MDQFENLKLPLPQLTNGDNEGIAQESKAKTTSFSDLDLTRWKEYADTVITDSLWLLGRRDSSGMHTPEYWGNFVPQIATQSIMRFTRRGETVLDPFVGLGTTLIECKRLGRNGIGIDLVPSVIEKAKHYIDLESNPYEVLTSAICGDSRLYETKKTTERILHKYATQRAHLLILHPPYHDIIKFSDLEADLSNSKSEDDFYFQFEQVLENFTPLLENHRYLVLVIGDKYTRGEWIPLGFRTMERVIKHGYKLKSICVKDIQGNRGKRNQHNLWRYRALKLGFYIFKHEYIMFFQKKKMNTNNAG